MKNKIVRILHLIIVITIIGSITTGCTKDDEQTKAESKDNFKTKTKHRVTIMLGNRKKIITNAVSIQLPNKDQMVTIINLDDGTSMKIIGGTVYWEDNIKYR